MALFAKMEEELCKKRTSGNVSIGDVLIILAANLKTENRYFTDYITGEYTS